MSQTAITVENLGKKYLLRHKSDPGYGTFMDTLAGGLRAAAGLLKGRLPRRTTREEFWALRGLDLQIAEGEVMGIIGRNGAGKSTLLKLLSRITEPTTGRIRFRGRVASLLEVGTGFHPELTGRENVFLNGAILGMGKREIARKFDEIVAFAEVDKFLDTPVKRFSSGMYVRLAFSVAAHLEPDILVVDEVLAVGDSQFQKKCIGRMREVAKKEGRTVLFVSHNMQAVQSLCTTATYLEKGRKVQSGQTRAVVAAYLAALGATASRREWTEGDRPGNHEFQLVAMEAMSEDGTQGVFSSVQDIHVDVVFDLLESPPPGLKVGFDVINSEGVTGFASFQNDSAPDTWPTPLRGRNHWRCTIPAGLLNAGIYYVCPRVENHNLYWIVNSDSGLQLEVVLDHGVSPFWNGLREGRRAGLIAPILQWHAVGAPVPAAR